MQDMQTVTLPAQCDRTALPALLDDLIAAARGAVMVDGSRVEQAGQSLLQLLVSLRKTQSETMIVPSEQLRALARCAGLERFLFDEAQS